MQMGMSSGLRWCCSGQAAPSAQAPCSQRGHTARLVLSCLRGRRGEGRVAALGTWCCMCASPGSSAGQHRSPQQASWADIRMQQGPAQGSSPHSLVGAALAPPLALAGAAVDRAVHNACPAAAPPAAAPGASPRRPSRSCRPPLLLLAAAARRLDDPAPRLQRRSYGGGCAGWLAAWRPPAPRCRAC